MEGFVNRPVVIIPSSGYNNGYYGPRRTTIENCDNTGLIVVLLVFVFALIIALMVVIRAKYITTDAFGRITPVMKSPS